MAYWTIEEVAEFLDITVAKVYDSRKRKEYPGVLGKQRGRRLMFDRALIEAGPQPDANTTDDVNVAILWALGGIERTLGELVKKEWSLDVTTTQDHHGPTSYEIELSRRTVEALERIAEALENPPEGADT